MWEESEAWEVGWPVGVFELLNGPAGHVLLQSLMVPSVLWQPSCAFVHTFLVSPWLFLEELAGDMAEAAATVSQMYAPPGPWTLALSCHLKQN